MKVSYEVLNDVLVTRIEGDLDIKSKGELAQSSEFAAPFRDTIFDLNQTRYIDSSGLGVLVALARQVQDSGKRVALASQNPVIAKILKITSLNRVFPMADSVEKAMSLLREPQCP